MHQNSLIMILSILDVLMPGKRAAHNWKVSTSRSLYQALSQLIWKYDYPLCPCAVKTILIILSASSDYHWHRLWCNPGSLNMNYSWNLSVLGIETLAPTCSWIFTCSSVQLWFEWDFIDPGVRAATARGRKKPVRLCFNGKPQSGSLLMSFLHCYEMWNWGGSVCMSLC